MGTEHLVEVDVIVPVHNAEETLQAAVGSAMNQQKVIDDGDCSELLNSDLCISKIHILCYDDGSTDSSWSILEDLKKQYSKVEDGDDNNDTTRHGIASSQKGLRIPTQLWIAKSENGVGRGAGFARNRAVAMREEVSSASRSNKSGVSNENNNDITQRFICMLDSDDVMHPTRVFEQVRYMLSLPEKERERTLLGCMFDRDPPDSTWHYAQWANGLSDERLMLERYRECTVIQPTWMMCRARFQQLGGYLEAPPPSIGNTSTIEQFVRNEQEFEGFKIPSQDETLKLVHPTFESMQSLRFAEDLRFFHAHLHANGRLALCRTNNSSPLLTYRHRSNQSQSYQTSRKLLLYLRALAFETSVLEAKGQWQKNNGAFIVWGAGRDGKDFIKA